MKRYKAIQLLITHKAQFFIRNTIGLGAALDVAIRDMQHVQHCPHCQTNLREGDTPDANTRPEEP